MAVVMESDQAPHQLVSIQFRQLRSRLRPTVQELQLMYVSNTYHNSLLHS